MMMLSLLLLLLLHSEPGRLVVAYQHEMCTRVTEWKKLVTPHRPIRGTGGSEQYKKKKLEIASSELMLKEHPR